MKKRKKELKDDEVKFLFRAQEAAQLGVDCCPVCVVQTVRSIPDISWISCPLVTGKLICVGCCFDFQSTVRSKNFETHPSLSDLEVLATTGNKEIIEMRKSCLSHQIQLCHYDIGKAKNAFVITEMEKRIAELESLLVELGP